MNSTIESLHDHRSVRSFTDEPVDEATLDAILMAVQRAPSSINAQDVSIIVVRDPERRARIAALAGGQPWIAKGPVFLCFVIDLSKTALGCSKHGASQKTQASVEGLLAGCLDAGIALGTAIAAAESLGLGTVPIGAIRARPREMIELLGLPKLTFPMNGLVIGHPAGRPPRKPRMPMAAFRHDERYDASRMKDAIDAYDASIVDYVKSVGRQAVEGSWSETVSKFFDHVYFPEVGPTVRAQGFTLEE